MIQEFLLLFQISWLLLKPGLVACVKVMLIFLGLIAVRVTVPRLKLESLSRLGWLLGLVLALVPTIMYVFFWFTF